MFNERYDKHNAIISVYAGAGGHDAEDWAEMLFKMYQKYSEKRGWITKTIHYHEGPEGGLNNGAMEIFGQYAYGYLKKENGVHRLVRISPFSAKQLRHTSFALIEVLPQFEEIDKETIILKEEDLKIDTFRSSGPGGQNVNKRESAVRITHLPTGLVAASQSERLQSENREKAMSILKAKLASFLEKHQAKELSELKGKKVKIEWGNQIRSYILHPYKMVKDHRTNIETTKVEEVLNGDLSDFLAS